MGQQLGLRSKVEPSGTLLLALALALRLAARRV
jgi:hypothetical protein